MPHEHHWTTIQLPRSHFPETVILLAIPNYFKQFNLFGTSWNILYWSNRSQVTCNYNKIIQQKLNSLTSLPNDDSNSDEKIT